MLLPRKGTHDKMLAVVPDPRARRGCVIGWP
jgi:hypothetical protein